ncbi:unnamed protein product [Triticum turgidum subsp. durum]|uniref:PSMD12/CSN4-like N-terminal domain-containing protein n=1 Tax=Triticum turgidum subsp. durum TaxID=4567 RepID=A0A9R1A6P4_TRITD|nr:unnamed protein product [Triticum turgidum subsp. durum]
MAIESLLNAEKQCCLAGDVASTRKDIVELSFKDGAWKTLNYHIVLLSNRRGQLKEWRHRGGRQWRARVRGVHPRRATRLHRWLRNGPHHLRALREGA